MNGWLPFLSKLKFCFNVTKVTWFPLNIIYLVNIELMYADEMYDYIC